MFMLGAIVGDIVGSRWEYFFKKHHVERKKGMTREVSIF
jgi:hypothetical protein